MIFKILLFFTGVLFFVFSSFKNHQIKEIHYPQFITNKSIKTKPFKLKVNPKIRTSKIQKTIWPTQGSVTSKFGLRHHPIHDTQKFHFGIDIANSKNTDVLAVLDGRVTFAGPKGGYGKTLILDHRNGYKTLYAHNEILFVKKGQFVEQGTLISRMGKTGLSTGDHLHFEVIFHDNKINPLLFLNQENIEIPKSAKDEKIELNFPQ